MPVLIYHARTACWLFFLGSAEPVQEGALCGLPDAVSCGWNGRGNGLSRLRVITILVGRTGVGVLGVAAFGLGLLPNIREYPPSPRSCLSHIPNPAIGQLHGGGDTRFLAFFSRWRFRPRSTRVMVAAPYRGRNRSFFPPLPDGREGLAGWGENS
jgi:hypothetical protein